MRTEVELTRGVFFPVAGRPQCGRRCRSVFGAIMLLSSLLTSGLLVAEAEAEAAAVAVAPVRLIGDGPGHAGLYGWGAATMRDGSVLIGDYWNFRIAHYATDGTYLGDVVTNGKPLGADPHQAPYGIAVDPTNDDVYFGDVDSNKTIDKYDSSGRFLLSWGGNSTATVTPVGQYKYPARMAVGPDRRVYVADQWDHNIEICSPSGECTKQFGGTGTGNGQFRQVRGIAMGPNVAGGPATYLYIADNYNSRIQVFDSEGNYIRMFGSGGDNLGQFSTGRDLRGVAVDAARGWVYVVDAASAYVTKFSLDGTPLLRWGGYGLKPGQFAAGGRDVTVDGDGNVWVGDAWNWRAQKFAPDGRFLLEVPSAPTAPPPTGFNGPLGVAVDPSGNVVVADTRNQRVSKFSPTGTPTLQWGRRGGESLLNYPRGVGVDPRNGDVVVANTDNHRIQKYSPNGALKWDIGEFGKLPGQFLNSNGLAVGTDGRIYVLDTQNQRVQILDENGAVLSVFGTNGSGAGQFRFARSIAIDSDQSLWITDSTRGVVQHFTNSGAFLSAFGALGTADNQFSQAFGVAVNSDHVYVADGKTHKIKVWTKSTPHQLVRTFGGYGRDLGQLGDPSNIAFGPNGHLFVVEQNNERVTEFVVGSVTDTTPPVSRVTSPSAKSAVVAPDLAVRFEGGASDDTVVSNQQVAIKDAAGNYWRSNGTWGAIQWHQAAMASPGTSSTSWIFDWTAPSFGSYSVLARATDGVGLTTTTSVAFSVAAEAQDTEAPVGGIATPTANQSLPLKPVSVTGSASDNRGVTTARLSYKDKATSSWYQADGSWGPAQVWFEAKLAAPGSTATTWSATWHPPKVSGTSSYLTQLQVMDAAGNVNSPKPTVPFTVTNREPKPAEDAASTYVNRAVTVSVLGNDVDPDDNIDPSTVTIKTAPSRGSAVPEATGLITYTPAANVTGTDSFAYEVCDGVGLCGSALVTMTVHANSAPTASDDTAVTDEDAPVTVAVLDNDMDPDGNLSPSSVVVTTGPAGGSTTVDSATGVATYSPSPGFDGPDAFAYQVCDTGGLCASASVHVTVNPRQ